jgi:hypothetical protein
MHRDNFTFTAHAEDSGIRGKVGREVIGIVLSEIEPRNPQSLTAVKEKNR